jgi:hypothetical protein
VRMSALYRLQGPERKQRIRDAIVAGATPYVSGGRVTIPCSAAMFTGRKPQ